MLNVTAKTSPQTDRTQPILENSNGGPGFTKWPGAAFVFEEHK